jgi:hypothetical protein
MLDVLVLPKETIQKTKPDKFYMNYYDFSKFVLNNFYYYCPYCSNVMTHNNLFFTCEICNSKFKYIYCGNDICCITKKE